MFYGLLAGCKGLLSIDLYVCVSVYLSLQQLRHQEITLQWRWVCFTSKQNGKRGGTKERYHGKDVLSGGKISVFTCMYVCACPPPLSLCHVIIAAPKTHTHVLSAFSDRTKYQHQAGCANMQTIPWPLLHKLFIDFSLLVPKAGSRQDLLELWPA